MNEHLSTNLNVSSLRPLHFLSLKLGCWVKINLTVILLENFNILRVCQCRELLFCHVTEGVKRYHAETNWMINEWWMINPVTNNVVCSDSEVFDWRLTYLNRLFIPLRIYFTSSFYWRLLRYRNISTWLTLCPAHLKCWSVSMGISRWCCSTIRVAQLYFFGLAVESG